MSREGGARAGRRPNTGAERGLGPGAGGGREALLVLLDQLLDLVLAPFVDQLDRVGIAVDDPLEELLAVLVGGERPLRPAAVVVEDHRQAGVGLAQLLAGRPLP